MDQVVNVEMISITVVFVGTVLPAFEVGQTWPVSHVRNEISIVMSMENCPVDYDLVVERPGYPNVKVRT